MQRQAKPISTIYSKRGATGLAYGLAIGLIAIVSLNAIGLMGESVNDLFTDVADTQGAVVDGTIGASNDPGAGGPIAIVEDAGAKRWEDGSQPATCDGYVSAASGYQSVSGSDSADDGIYWINSGGSPFQAYCNMSYDGGGWTLLAHIMGGEFDPSSTFWDGTLGSNNSFTMEDGATLNSSMLENVIANVPFGTIWVSNEDARNNPDPTYQSDYAYVANFSNSGTTLAQKKAATESVSSVTCATLPHYQNCDTAHFGWNFSYTGSYTTVQLLFGWQQNYLSYGDWGVYGLGAHASSTLSCGTGGGPDGGSDCDRWFMIGEVGHRGNGAAPAQSWAFVR